MRPATPRSSPPVRRVPSRPPALAWLIPAAAGLAIALSTTGCVGPADLADAGKDQEAADAYVRGTETMCLRLLEAVPDAEETEEQSRSEGKTEAEFVADTRDGMVDGLDAVERSARDMYALTAPERWSDYQRRVERNRSGLDRVLRDSRAAVLALSSYDDVIGLESTLVGTGLSGPDRVPSPVEYLPRDLLDRTPSCRRVQELTAEAERAAAPGGPSDASADPDRSPTLALLAA
ncbi:hypothetical protein [Patulibacter minatonensis]|uniref:hypothetical protein n=1 Tax=Patulibacter minatonensis TaxID=298163 RepID=UPI00047B59D7|nr:hypothetical protein [Patulibacter minatonensis]